MTVERPNGSTFDSFLYYPALSDGQDAAYDGSGAPYPGISFGHGYLGRPENYHDTLAHLASWGYFVMATESFEGFAPDTSEYADDLRRCLTYLETENDTSGSFLYGQVDVERFGVSGHSMGGGASIVATARDTRVDAVAPMAAAVTAPGSIEAMKVVHVPVELLAGSHDLVVPPDQVTQPQYDNGHAPKLFPLIAGGTHNGFSDGVNPRQLEETWRLMTGFFNLYLQADETTWSWVWGPAIARDSTLTLQSDPGIAISPRTQSGSGGAGQTTTYDLVVTNAGEVPASYTMLVEGNRWPTSVDPSQTAVLQPGQSAAVTVRVTVQGSGSARDVAVVSARSDRDGLTRTFAVTVTRRT